MTGSRLAMSNNDRQSGNYGVGQAPFLAVLVLIALALCTFRTSLGGQKLFGVILYFGKNAAGLPLKYLANRSMCLRLNSRRSASKSEMLDSFMQAVSAIFFWLTSLLSIKWASNWDGGTDSMGWRSSSYFSTRLERTSRYQVHVHCDHRMVSRRDVA